MGHLPSFIIVGAMKSGTTSLHQYLCRHKDIFMCSPKEPMFFSHDNVYKQGEEWYRSQFTKAAPHQICGEASQSYSRWPHYPNALERMAKLIPDVKIIYLMRHPVDRVYSHYTHMMEQCQKKGKSIMSFEEALESSKEYLDTSQYMLQINQFLNYFPRDQFCFLTLDEFKENPVKILTVVQKFLGVPEVDLIQGRPIKANISNGRLVAKNVLTNQIHSCRHRPGISQLVNLIPKPFRQGLRKRTVEKLVDSKAGKRIASESREQWSPFLAATRQKLLAAFQEPTRALENFLRKDLSAWYE